MVFGVKEVITNVQSVFRKNGSTIDQLIRQEIFIGETFIKKGHLSAIFFFT